MSIDIALCLVMACSLASSRPQGVSETSPVPDQQRVNTAINQLESKDRIIQIRATEELAEVAPVNARVRERLIRHLSAVHYNSIGGAQVVWHIARALAASEPSCVDRLLEEYRHSKSEESIRDLLVVLGHMGPKASKAIPFLQEQLERSDISAKTKCAIQVVLANLGSNVDQIRKKLINDIRERNDCGKAAVQTLTFTIPGQWVDDEWITELIKWLDGTADEPFYAAYVLGRMGPRAMAAVEPLKRSAEQELKEGSLGVLVYELVLAEIDRPKHQKWLTTALAHLGPNPTRELTWLPASLDPDLIKDIEQLVDDKDIKVVGGAVAILSMIGLPAKRAAPTLLRIVEGDKTEELRYAAVWALAFVGDPSDVQKLEHLQQKEKSERIREAIQKTIRILRLESPSAMGSD